MVIWLSHPRIAHVADALGKTRYGVDEDIVARETFGMLASVDNVYGRAEAERQGILAAAEVEREQLLQAARAEADVLVTEAARNAPRRPTRAIATAWRKDSPTGLSRSRMSATTLTVCSVNSASGWPKS